MTTNLTHADCLDHSGRTKCDGEVEYRAALSSTGTPFPRCDRHWSSRLKVQEDINAKYGGDCPPRGFDSSYAGETW